MQLDKTLISFLRQQGNGQDISKDFVPVDADLTCFPPNFGIQQNLEEFLEFIEFCKESKATESIIEVGFGYHGTSHAILRHFFERVISIDNQLDRMRQFYFNAQRHFGEEFFSDRKSYFVGGDSNSAETLLKVTNILRECGEIGMKKVDILFIDGSHTLNNVLLDFLLYESLIKLGGFVAFHDINNPMKDNGVSKCRNLLNDMHLINQRYKLCKEISYARSLGIAIYQRLT